MFLKTYNTDFYDIAITFTKLIWHCLLINRDDTNSIEPRTRKYVKGYGFLSFERNLSNKYGQQLLDAATKTELQSSS